MSEPYEYKTTLEKKIDRIISPFESFVDTQIASGLILLAAVFISLLLSNTPLFSSNYNKFINFEFSLGVEQYLFKFSLKDFVDEFLLLFFFLILGLEIKREIMAGELADFRKSVVVIFAACGGMVVPALMYFMFNDYGTKFFHGWAIPIATDTAIAIGLMSLFKKKLPKGIFTLVAAIAVVDDIVAITIIALFYSGDINKLYLFYAGLTFFSILLANFLGVRNFILYLFPGLLIWLFFEKAGVHGSISGVLIAFAIPARPKTNPYFFVNKIKKLVKRFEKAHDHSKHILEQGDEHALLEQVSAATEQASVPLKRWEFILEKPVLFIILPLFALTNGAIVVNFNVLGDLINSPLFWGIFFGLVLGKPFGIMLFSYICLKLVGGKLPTDVCFRDMVPMSMIAGIGYTMAIFVTGLAFDDSNIINMAKFSIVLASLAAGVLASGLIEYNYRLSKPD